MKVFKFEWPTGWQWDCPKLQRLARWIDLEVKEVFKKQKGI